MLVKSINCEEYDIDLDKPTLLAQAIMRPKSEPDDAYIFEPEQKEPQRKSA